MSDPVVQWLNEIKLLKQQISDLQQVLETANISVDRWRRLYETEAQQRRQEAQSAQQAIDGLQAQLQSCQAPAAVPTDPADPELESQLTNLSAEGIKAQLLAMWAERNRLVQALQQEQVAHERTRKELTTALADAMELLSKSRTPPDESH
jgi:predicted  nucleic acid-binding Zn-ribbon protein